MTHASRLPNANHHKATTKSERAYCGRFAPSPTGPLHFGSLVCALASYLHAKQHNGQWFVRIEDIDTPRVEKNTIDLILEALNAHGLHWDQEVVFQSHRQAIYSAYLDKLQHAHSLYACSCTRSQIRALGDAYSGRCRHKNLPYASNSTRFKHTTDNSHFVDMLLGNTHITHAMATEDPVLKRADGIFCYHLAAVVDDIEQDITHIVRGGDLLETTPVHLSLYQAFNKTPPQYMHIPVIVQKPHEKLSKQHNSPAVDNSRALENLKLALVYLGMSAKTMTNIATIEQILTWAITNWHPNLIPKQSELLISIVNGVYSAPQSMKLRNASSIIDSDF